MQPTFPEATKKLSNGENHYRQKKDAASPFVCAISKLPTAESLQKLAKSMLFKSSFKL